MACAEHTVVSKNLAVANWSATSYMPHWYVMRQITLRDVQAGKKGRLQCLYVFMIKAEWAADDLTLCMVGKWMLPLRRMMSLKLY